MGGFVGSDNRTVAAIHGGAACGLRCIEAK
jgi:hypothetical protein